MQEHAPQPLADHQDRSAAQPAAQQAVLAPIAPANSEKSTSEEEVPDEQGGLFAPVQFKLRAEGQRKGPAYVSEPVVQRLQRVPFRVSADSSTQQIVETTAVSQKGTSIQRTGEEAAYRPVSADREHAQHLQDIRPLIGAMENTFRTSYLIRHAQEEHERLMDPSTGQYMRVEIARSLVQITDIIERRALDYAVSRRLVRFGEEDDDLTQVLNPDEPLFGAIILAEPFQHVDLWNRIIERGVIAEPRLAPPEAGRATPEFAYAPVISELFITGSIDTEDSRGIDPNDVIQNQLGDCYFLAAVAAMARADPEALRSLIRNNQDGTYTVRLYTDRRGRLQTSATEVTVTSAVPLSQGGTHEYAETGSDTENVEMWVAILEKAYATIRGGYNVLDEGGFGEEGLGALTGRRPRTYSLSSMSRRRILELVNEALTNQWPITADTRSISTTVETRLNIVGDHVYAPSAIDLANETIDLQNPWGNDHLLGFSVANFKRYFEEMAIIRDYNAAT
ncbi:MAG: hypothetical protein IT260_24120 [Saprospiraceae bacterium]|nr:hypothetical protein [Saprospiraceae bacterium]